MNLNMHHCGTLSLTCELLQVTFEQGTCKAAESNIAWQASTGGYYMHVPIPCTLCPSSRSEYTIAVV